MSKVLLLTFVYSLTTFYSDKGLVAFAGDTNNVNDGPSEAYRLPDTTEPVSYDLRITPTIRENSFRGQVDIVVKAKQYTTEVILNSKDLTVSSVSWFQDLKTNRTTAIKDYVYEERNERLVIKLEKSILPSRLYKFSIVFSGILREDYTGFHKYFYDSGNHSRYLYMCNLEQNTCTVYNIHLDHIMIIFLSQKLIFVIFFLSSRLTLIPVDHMWKWSTHACHAITWSENSIIKYNLPR